MNLLSFIVFIVDYEDPDYSYILEKSFSSAALTSSSIAYSSEEEGPKHSIFLLLTLARYHKSMVTPKIIRMARRIPIQSCQADSRLVLLAGVSEETGYEVELVV